MNFEKIKSKIRENGENLRSIHILKRGIRYREKKGKMVMVINAKFLLKLNGRICLVQVRDGTIVSELPDDLSIVIFILSKHRVVLLEVDTEGNEVEWYFGGFDSYNSDMCILGCIEFEVFTSFVYCNQGTNTPLIMMESVLETKELPILFDSVSALITNKKKEDSEYVEMEL